MLFLEWVNSPWMHYQTDFITDFDIDIARFRDVQWRQIWCIVGLKVDVNKTTSFRGTVKRINQ